MSQREKKWIKIPGVDYPLLSPKWKDSKFGDMSDKELAEYVWKSEDNRKEVREMFEDQYRYVVKNYPSLMSGTMKSYKSFLDRRGGDMFDPQRIYQYDKPVTEEEKRKHSIATIILVILVILGAILNVCYEII
jgi:hypothetical protein